jgi:hypothetical protein
MLRPQLFRDTVDAAFLAALVLATRVPFRSHSLYDIDSVNFALGMRRFDPTVHQPHPPGYFLYVCAGRLVNAFMHDANAALVAIGVAASCGAVVLIYALAQAWFGGRAGLFAGMMFVFSPLAWFHGTVALTYSVEAFFSALTGYLCWNLCRGRAVLIMPAAVVVGIAAGFRPSFPIFLGPLLLFSAMFIRGRIAGAGLLTAAGALVLAVSAWAVPMLKQSGGWYAWWSSLRSAWLAVPARQTVFNSSPATSLARFFSIGGILILCFGGAAAFAFLRRNDIRSPRLRAFVWVWIAPAMLFFTLVFLKFVNSGYLLVISPPMFALLGWKASEWYQASVLSSKAKAALLFGLAAANSLIFLFAPVYCSWTAVRRFEMELRSTLTSLPKVASPGNTMIVGFDSHFLGYRHAGYYLPGWCTVEFPEVRLSSGTKVFSMEHRDTQILARLPVERFRRFVLLPLPAGDSEYREYMSRVRARFPAGKLETVYTGGREFLIGNVTDLNLLFPATAK